MPSGTLSNWLIEAHLIGPSLATGQARISVVFPSKPAAIVDRGLGHKVAVFTSTMPQIVEQPGNDYGF
jgi:hypothetical protein